MNATLDLNPDTRYAVGLDVGDGESCLFWIDTPDRDAQAQLYERTRPPERTVLTALARDSATQARIFGEAAVLARDAIQFAVNFKTMPSAAQLGTPDMVLFAQAFLEEFFQAHPEVRESCQILVGYPTGWPDEARETYLRFLRTGDLPLTLLPESQSALVHVWDLRHKPTEGGPQPDVDNVLVIDIGSSTVDVTMVTDLEPINVEVGAELGCADIDRELAELAKNALAADPTFRAAMAPPDAEALLRLACRRAKEAQFTGRSLVLHDRAEALTSRFDAILGSLVGWLRLQDIPLLVEQGWAVRFRDLLVEVRDTLKRPPEVVVLTGGGSRMPVTRKIATEVFPDVTPEQDEAPSFSVGRGLASAGRHRIQALRFRLAATGVTTRPEVTQALREATAAAFTAVRDHTHEVLSGLDLNEWKAVIESPPGMEHVVRDLEETIDRTVRPRVNEVCDEYSIPYDQRDLVAKITPPRLFTEEFVARASGLPGRPGFPGDTFQGTWILWQGTRAGARAAAPLAGAGKIAGWLRGAAKGGAQSALILVGAYAVIVAGVWATETYTRHVQRREALVKLAAMELPAEAVVMLEQELSREVARVVEERIAPLERMVR